MFAQVKTVVRPEDDNRRLTQVQLFQRVEQFVCRLGRGAVFAGRIEGGADRHDRSVLQEQLAEDSEHLVARHPAVDDRVRADRRADLAVAPLQDFLGLGSEARMNTPSTLGPPNWCWRLRAGALTEEIAERLLTMTSVYGRRPPKPGDEEEEEEAATELE